MASSSETAPLLGGPGSSKPAAKTVSVSLDAKSMRFVRGLAYIVALAQIGVSVAAIVLTLDQSCDRPLKLFIILYALRIFLAVPFHGRAHFGVWSTPENTRTASNVLLAFVDLFALVLFVFANFWIVRSQTCQETAPWAYWVSFVWVIWEWVTIAVPLLLCTCIYISLPFGTGVVLALIILMSILRPGSHMAYLGRPVVAQDNLDPHRPIVQAPPGPASAV